MITIENKNPKLINGLSMKKYGKIRNTTTDAYDNPV